MHFDCILGLGIRKIIFLSVVIKKSFDCQIIFHNKLKKYKLLVSFWEASFVK